MQKFDREYRKVCQTLKDKAFILMIRRARESSGTIRKP